MIQKTHTIQDKSIVTDSSKGHKIVAALYLVTNHLGDRDPLRVTIRTHAVALLDRSEDIATITTRLVDLLHASRFAGIMSEQNVAILIKELTHFRHSSGQVVFGTLFESELPYSPKGRQMPKMSFMSDSPISGTSKNDVSIDNKNKRQDQILSFINDRKSAAIKDIAGLFPEVSEKTIQRELGTLVESGKITKRGSKRWSIYLANS